MKLTATILDDELDDMNLVEYVFVNEMSLEHLLSNLTYLEIPYIYDYFKSIVMPTLPPSMHSLYLGSTDDNDPFFESLLTRLTNLKRLGLEYTSLNEQDYTYFKATRFTTLVSLALCHVELDDNILIINFDNFPNLKDLVIAENGEIQFIGVSKITALTISDLGFKLNTLKVDQFPELRILKVKHFYNLRVQQLRELFSFPNLTSLTIKTYSCDLLLLQEVFIKQNTNLIKLKIHGFSLGSYFYNFITKHCPNLMVYILNRCEFIDDIKFNRKNVNLNLNLIEIANCEEGYGFNEHVKWLLENSKNLKKIIIDDTNLPFNLIDKYSNIIEFDA
ncbi:hypothetical protein K502DRAFT_323189 [Neoconidiobolus thromboides FSU 785]|nr:hypothetical protein K502DRAFT_323189 [Neoconidiobolus thromboides FSU 785]